MFVSDAGFSMNQSLQKRPDGGSPSPIDVDPQKGTKAIFRLPKSAPDEESRFSTLRPQTQESRQISTNSMTNKSRWLHRSRKGIFVAGQGSLMMGYHFSDRHGSKGISVN
jgi:hypothetical protein